MCQTQEEYEAEYERWFKERCIDGQCVSHTYDELRGVLFESGSFVSESEFHARFHNK